MQLNARILLLAGAINLGVLGMSIPSDAAAQQAVTPIIAADSTLLNVAATGKTTRVPDIANFSTGVVTRAADANTAMRDNATQMDKVVKALRAAGIPERDIQTSGISLNPDYNYRDNQPPQITGYSTNNTVSVKVRDLTKLGKIMDILVANGANQLNGPNFSIDDEAGAMNDARKSALKDAQTRAEMYAQTLGMRVRRIVSIDEQNTGGFYPRPVAMRATAADSAAKSTPVMPGESEVSVSLNVQFELGR